MRRQGNGLGLFLWGAGIGIVGGILLSAWFEKEDTSRQQSDAKNQDNMKYNTDEIVALAKNFIQEEIKGTEQPKNTTIQ